MIDASNAARWIGLTSQGASVNRATLLNMFPPILPKSKRTSANGILRQAGKAGQRFSGSRFIMAECAKLRLSAMITSVSFAAQLKSLQSITKTAMDAGKTTRTTFWIISKRFAENITLQHTDKN
jgi:hypothetical protein